MNVNVVAFCQRGIFGPIAVGDSRRQVWKALGTPPWWTGGPPDPYSPFVSNAWCYYDLSVLFDEEFRVSVIMYDPGQDMGNPVIHAIDWQLDLKEEVFSNAESFAKLLRKWSISVTISTAERCQTASFPLGRAVYLLKRTGHQIFKLAIGNGSRDLVHIADSNADEYYNDEEYHVVRPVVPGAAIDVNVEGHGLRFRVPMSVEMGDFLQQFMPELGKRVYLHWSAIERA
ncbi:MAG: hypothetical protein KDB14_26825 [Planctomycetales bacterium]|nr:hypothetical protein [Planctomycetales bacterium]